jgi:hypothetical protein
LSREAMMCDRALAVTSTLVGTALLAIAVDVAQAQGILKVGFAGQPLAPAEIVTVPCAETHGAARVDGQRGLTATQLQMFSVGVVGRNGRSVRAVRLGRVTVRERGSLRTKGQFHEIAASDPCGIPIVPVIADGPSALGLWVYLSKVWFADGTSWEVAEEGELQASLAASPPR